MGVTKQLQVIQRNRSHVLSTMIAKQIKVEILLSWVIIMINLWSTDGI